jgi:hypothetical protein
MTSLIFLYFLKMSQSSFAQRQEIIEPHGSKKGVFWFWIEGTFQ